MGRVTDLAVRELRILVAVERRGSFTAAAAEELGLTQSAVSHAVTSCERKIGAVLFDRGRHGARPTPTGARAAGPARPTRSVGYVTTPELARTLAVRALIRELRAVAAR